MRGPSLPPFKITDKPDENGVYTITWLDCQWSVSRFDSMDWFHNVFGAYMDYCYKNVSCMEAWEGPPPMLVSPHLFYCIGTAMNSKGGFYMDVEMEYKWVKIGLSEPFLQDGKWCQREIMDWRKRPIVPNQYKWMNGVKIIEFCPDSFHSYRNPVRP